MKSPQELKADADAYDAAYGIYATLVDTAEADFDAAREKAKLDYEAACDAAGDVFDAARGVAFTAFAASPAYKADAAAREAYFATNKGKTK